MPLAKSKADEVFQLLSEDYGGVAPYEHIKECLGYCGVPWNEEHVGGLVEMLEERSDGYMMASEFADWCDAFPETLETVHTQIMAMQECGEEDAEGQEDEDQPSDPPQAAEVDEVAPEEEERQSEPVAASEDVVANPDADSEAVEEKSAGDVLADTAKPSDHAPVEPEQKATTEDHAEQGTRGGRHATFVDPPHEQPAIKVATADVSSPGVPTEQASVFTNDTATQPESSAALCFKKLSEATPGAIPYALLRAEFERAGIAFSADSVGPLFEMAEEEPEGSINEQEWRMFAGLYPAIVDELLVGGPEASEMGEPPEHAAAVGLEHVTKSYTVPSVSAAATIGSMRGSTIAGDDDRSLLNAATPDASVLADAGSPVAHDYHDVPTSTRDGGSVMNDDEPIDPDDYEELSNLLRRVFNDLEQSAGAATGGVPYTALRRECLRLDIDFSEESVGELFQTAARNPQGVFAYDEWIRWGFENRAVPKAIYKMQLDAEARQRQEEAARMAPAPPVQVDLGPITERLHRVDENLQFFSATQVEKYDTTLEKLAGLQHSSDAVTIAIAQLQESVGKQTEETLTRLQADVTEQLESVKTTLLDVIDRANAESLQKVNAADEMRSAEHAEMVKKVGFLDERLADVANNVQLLASNVGELLKFHHKMEEDKEQDWIRVRKLYEQRSNKVSGSGTKMRLIVSVVPCDGDESAKTDMMVVAYSNDYVSDVIASALRRAMVSRVVPENVHPNQCNLYSTNPTVLLFSEDSLEDLDIKEGTTLKMTTAAVEAPAPAMPMPSRQPQYQQQRAPQAQYQQQQSNSYNGKYSPTSSASGSSYQPTSQVPSRYYAESPTSTEQREPTRSGLSSRLDLADIVLDASDAKRLADREDLERRLVAETFRMERDPMIASEKRERIAVAKTDLHGVRMKLVDRATYSANEVHRAAARVTLEKLNRVLEDPLVTVEAMNAARRQSEMALNELQGSKGEDERVEMLQDAQRQEEKRKKSAVEELKDLIHVIHNRLRIPDTLLGRAESLVDKADSAIILHAGMSREEVQAIVQELNEFITSVRGPAG